MSDTIGFVLAVVLILAVAVRGRAVPHGDCKGNDCKYGERDGL